MINKFFDLSSSIREYGTSQKIVVLIMGRGAPGKVWASHQVPFLVKSGYKAVIFDNRGSGLYADITIPFTIEDMVEDTINIIEKYKKKVFLVGTSLGARIAQEVALKKPELLHGVFLAAAHARLSSIQKIFGLEQLKLKEAAFEEHKLYFVAQTILNNFSTQFIFDEKNITDWLEMISYSSQKTTTGEKLQILLDKNFDRREAYRNIMVPTLCLAYDEDKIIFPYQVKEVASVIANAEYKELKNSGHYGYLERPDEFNTILITFLASIKL